MDFRKMRIEAGFLDRREFCRFAGISPRTLSAYDGGWKVPPRSLVMLLAMLADGCRYCQKSNESNVNSGGVQRCRQINSH